MPNAPSPRASRKIVHAVLRLDVGGLERIVVQLARIGRSRGQLPHVLCVESRGTLADELEAGGVPVTSLDKPPGRHPEVIERAAEYLRSVRPDVVHTHQIGAAWYVATAAKKLGIPVIHTEHGNLFARLRGFLARAKARLFLWRTAKRIDRFGCISEEIARAVRKFPGVPGRKVRVYPNGTALPPEPVPDELAHLRQRLGIPEGAPVLGTVGRLNEVKRQAWLIEARKALGESLPGLLVLIVGDGPERAALEALADRLGVRERVRFAGYAADPTPYLRLMTVFALPSRSEGFPVSLLEAWGCRLPVVCSSVGGIPQIVRDGETGLLFAAQDKDGFHRSLETLLSDTDLRQRLGEAGYHEVESRYSLEKVADLYDANYEELIREVGEKS